MSYQQLCLHISKRKKNDIKHFVFILHLQTPSLFTSLVLKLKKSVGLLLWYVWTNPGWHWVDSRHWAGPLVSALVSVGVLFFFFFVNAISLDHDVIGTSRSVGRAWKLFLVLVTLKVKIICCFCLFCFVFDKKKTTTKKKTLVVSPSTTMSEVRLNMTIKALTGLKVLIGLTDQPTNHTWGGHFVFGADFVGVSISPTVSFFMIFLKSLSNFAHDAWISYLRID